jgi:hypothetical protein
MRFHPAVYHNYRQAVKDDVLPLSKPIRTTTGEEITKLPIPKGLKVILSISGYNRYMSFTIVQLSLLFISFRPCRNEEAFGEDAHVYNPERWFRDTGDKKTPNVGVYGNLYVYMSSLLTV